MSWAPEQIELKFAGYIPYVIWNVKMLFWIDLLPFGVIAS